MNVDLAVIVNKPVGEWLDESQQSQQDIIEWVNRIVIPSEKEARIKKDRCEICLSKEDPTDLELHHPGHGRYDYRTMTLCKKCHMALTESQMKNVAYLKGKISDDAKTALFLLGLQDILNLKADRTGDSNYKTLARKYTPMIREYLKD